MALPRNQGRAGETDAPTPNASHSVGATTGLAPGHSVPKPRSPLPSRFNCFVSEVAVRTVVGARRNAAPGAKSGMWRAESRAGATRRPSGHSNARLGPALATDTSTRRAFASRAPFVDGNTSLSLRGTSTHTHTHTHTHAHAGSYRARFADSTSLGSGGARSSAKTAPVRRARSDTRTRAHAHTRTRAHTHTRIHTHTHAPRAQCRAEKVRVADGRGATTGG